MRLSPLFAILALTTTCGIHPIFGAPARWEKIKTRDLKLDSEREFLTPGVFVPTLQREILLPKSGQLVSLDFPAIGRLENGQRRKSLMAAYKDEVLWLDSNADGKQDLSELHRPEAGQLAGPFDVKVRYISGWEGTYTFKLFHTGNQGRFRVVRCIAKQGIFQGKRIVFLDDNGNGQYDDIGKDMVVVEGQPATLLSSTLLIEDQFYELMVHSEGIVAEIRRMTSVKSGQVDLFQNFSVPQKSRSLTIQTVIVSGEKGAFSFDLEHPTLNIPEGEYKIVFGLFDRAKEWVYLQEGEQKAFKVTAGNVAAPKWGGPIKGTIIAMDLDDRIAVSPPLFYGATGEEYRPENFIRIPVRAFKLTVSTDGHTADNVNMTQGSKWYPVRPDGQLDPVIFAHFRLDTITLRANYQSGILGSILAEAKIGRILER